MPQPTRRGFLAGCSAAVAALAGARFNTLAYGAPGTEDEILLVIFLSGGMDGLNLVPPIDGVDRGHYETARPKLKVPTTGPDAALSLDSQFGLHPSAAPLLDLYQDGKLAMIHAVGSDDNNRSHFDAMLNIELGTPGNRSTSDGWLTRHLQSAPNLPTEIVLPSLSVGAIQTSSLLGSLETVNMADPSRFNLNTGPGNWRDAQRLALRRLYSNGTSELHATGGQALDALDIVELNVNGDYVPSNGAAYPGGDFGDFLKVVAQMIKLDLGLRVATLEYGGWDTHNQQGEGAGGVFGSQVTDLAEGLAAFYADLDGVGASNYTNRLTVVVQSEFGRRLRENDDKGTDHGHGNLMMVLSGNAVGGFHGTFPGLANEQLFDSADLAVTTDYRRVLSEILIRRLGNNHLGSVFPGYSDYSPLGFVDGVDLPPIYGDDMFSDGFESGDLSRWSSVVG